MPAVVAAVVLAAQLPARADQAAPPAAEVIARLLPAVANIATTAFAKEPPVAGNMVAQPTASQQDAQSSGFFIDPSGVLVTNRHAVATAGEIIVTLHDGTQLRACVLALSAQSDIALLRVNAGRALPVVAFGDSDAARPGDRVFIIGNPLGLGSTVTAGIVSALHRTTADSGFGAFFQLDASLNHGSSGGPVFDAAGHVVGVATALLSAASETGSVGLGLALPGRDAQFIVARLLRHDAAPLGWIGAHIQPLTADIAAASGLKLTDGAIVTAIDADSPAARGGLLAGDVVLQVGDEPVAVPQVLNRAIAASPAGGTVRLAVWRQREKRSLSVVVGAVPGEPAASATPQASAACAAPGPARPDLGLLLEPVTPDVRDRLGLPPDGAGVQVAGIVAGSVAADHALAAGSVIVSVGRTPVATPAAAQAGIAAARTAGDGFVMLLVRDRQGLRWLALPLAAVPAQ